MRKECFRLPDNPAHDLGGVWQVVDKTRCLSCDHGRRIEVALFPSFGVAPGLFLNILHQLHLSPKPPLGMGVTEHPSGKRGRSYVPPRDIENDTANGAITARVNNPLLGCRMALSLL